MRLTSRSPGFMTQGILKAPAVLCFGLLVFHVEAASARAADVWTIESGDIDPVHYAGISVANGMIGLLSAPHPFGTRQT
ncbi:MAG TPA: hypothetical protein VG496_13410, partial [Myxococcales bacterium]|nr:hypothetical protein [Myxococcales bacterium]